MASIRITRGWTAPPGGTTMVWLLTHYSLISCGGGVTFCTPSSEDFLMARRLCMEENAAPSGASMKLLVEEYGSAIFSWASDSVSVLDEDPLAFSSPCSEVHTLELFWEPGLRAESLQLEWVRYRGMTSEGEESRSERAVRGQDTFSWCGSNTNTMSELQPGTHRGKESVYLSVYLYLNNFFMVQQTRNLIRVRIWINVAFRQSPISSKI